MAIQIINTGSTANAGNGDSLRTAFNKVNTNFAYLGSSSGSGFTGSRGNLGYSGSIGYTGSTGTQGVIGFTGSGSTATGYTGSAGSAGSAGGIKAGPASTSTYIDLSTAGAGASLGTTLTNQTPVANAVYRFSAFGTVTTVNAATRYISFQIYWGSQNLGYVQTTVLSETITTAPWDVELMLFCITNDSLRITGRCHNRLSSTTNFTMNIVANPDVLWNNFSGALNNQTLDLRVSQSGLLPAVADIVNCQSVTIEQLV